MRLFVRLSFGIWLFLRLAFCGFAAQGPVTFFFTPAAGARNPFSRDISAEVSLPSGRELRLPAYFAGRGRFAVRVRANQKGEYRLGGVWENGDKGLVRIPAEISGDDHVLVRDVETMPSIALDSRDRSRFLQSDGAEYQPVGTNLAWAPKGRLSFYSKAFSAFHEETLNWARVWMCHWGGLNLDWLPDKKDHSPSPGMLDLRVAERWDRLLADAKKNGVYLQLVLQHHGQYTTGANPNWTENPWNVANGGFLNTPAEFFTSPRAMEITKRKYRYIVARYGWSPAILAWELFNEVHWVDALSKDHDVAAVATWHAEMADYIRSIDVYHHLVTTSTDDVSSPIYAKMDFLQPHLYAPNMLAAPQRFAVSPATLDRPIFYGEVGEDNMPHSERLKKSGQLIVPPVWASVMGEGTYAAQPWMGAQLLETRRTGELGAVARFVAAMSAVRHGPLDSFSPRVESGRAEPLVLFAGQHWRRGPAPRIVVPTDGRQTPAVADVPEFLVGGEDSIADGFTPKASFAIVYPKAVTAVVKFADAGPKGAAVRVVIDGELAAETVWPALPPPPRKSVERRPREISFPVRAGAHEIVLENTAGLDWVQFDSFTTGLERPVVAAVGKRSADFVAVWIWRRDGVFAEKIPAPLDDAVVVLDDVAAGDWKLTPWDSLKGVPGETRVLSHPGGDLRISIPPVSRHVAFILQRQPG